MKKKQLPSILLILIFVIGLSLLLYPTVSNYWNSFRQSKVIADYDAGLAALTEQDYSHTWAEAQAYNRTLPDNPGRYRLTEEELARYNGLVNVVGNGVMGYIEIPALDVRLSLYHGVSDAVLRAGVGHIEGTSLPVGGESTHCALSGHRGLPSAKLFTNLDRMTRGDVFFLHVLDRTLAYQVASIRTVLPNEMESLEIAAGEDLCTLVTCTPYGVNTHRLLVTGSRIPYSEALNLKITADATVVDRVLVASGVAAPLLLAGLVWLLFSTGRKAEKKQKNREEATGDET